MPKQNLKVEIVVLTPDAVAVIFDGAEMKCSVCLVKESVDTLADALQKAKLDMTRAFLNGDGTIKTPPAAHA